MAAGYEFTKTLVDTVISHRTKRVDDAVRDAVATYGWLQRFTDTEFQAIGYTIGVGSQHAQIMSAFGDLNLLGDVYHGVTGAGNTAEGKDFAQFTGLLWVP